MKYKSEDLVRLISKNWNIPVSVIEKVVNKFGNEGLWRIIEELQDYEAKERQSKLSALSRRKPLVLRNGKLAQKI